MQNRSAQCLKSEPWLAFVYAAGCDDVKMAKTAIALFEDDEDCPASRWPEVKISDFSAVPNDCSFDLLRRRARLQIEGEIMEIRYCCWAEVAKEFVVCRLRWLKARTNR